MNNKITYAEALKKIGGSYWIKVSPWLIRELNLYHDCAISVTIEKLKQIPLNEQVINCPACSTTIILDSKTLEEGLTYCPICNLDLPLSEINFEDVK